MIPTAASAQLPTEAAAYAPNFYNAATGAREQMRRVLKHGDTFAVFDSYGDIGALATGEDGLFHRDTRHLSRLELAINGMRPLLLGSNVRDDNVFLTVDLSNPDIFSDGRLALPKDAVHVTRSIFLWAVACWPQAWAAATPFSLVQASLGLEFDAAKNEIRLRNPRLPSFIDEMTIRNLSLAAATIDLALQRHGDEVSVRVIRRKGEVQVSALYG